MRFVGSTTGVMVSFNERRAVFVKVRAGQQEKQERNILILKKVGLAVEERTTTAGLDLVISHDRYELMISAVLYYAAQGTDIH